MSKNKILSDLLLSACEEYKIRVCNKDANEERLRKLGFTEKELEYRAFALQYKDRKYIFCDPLESLEDDFTLAHELGHHIMGHIDWRGKPEELEADLFATVLLAMSLFKKYEEAVA